MLILKTAATAYFRITNENELKKIGQLKSIILHLHEIFFYKANLTLNQNYSKSPLVHFSIIHSINRKRESVPPHKFCHGMTVSYTTVNLSNPNKVYQSNQGFYIQDEH